MSLPRRSTEALPQLVRLVARQSWVYPVETIGILLVIVAAEFSILAVPIFSKRLVDAFDSVPTTAASIGFFVVWYVLPIAGFRLLCWLLWRVSGFIASSLQPKVMRDLTARAFSSVLDQSYRFFTDSFTGSLVRRVKSLAQATRNLMESLWWDLLPMMIAVVGGLILLALRNPVLGLFLFAWIVILLIANIAVSHIKLPYDSARAAKDAETTGVMSDDITNAVNIALFTTRGEEERRLDKYLEEGRMLQRQSWRIGETGNLIQNIANAALEIAIMTIVVIQWRNGSMTVGDIVFAQGILLILFNITYDLGRVFRRIYEAAADSKEMLDLLEVTSEVRDVRKAKPIIEKRGGIEFRQVTFNYHGKRSVLRDFSLKISPKEKIALVGSSGAGKSTITKLLFRFYDLDGGSILIDGQDISKVTQDSLRQAIALVPQEPILFHRSLKENIAYGRRDATAEQVLDAARKAHCHEFIEGLQNGYDTLVGERGIKLSGGERQRVAIARAILKNAPILVLDEATSSLDSESESLIQDALRELMKDKTVIVIAHRLSTIMQMDRIIVMQDGKVTDTGTHKNLLQKVGVYQKLWNIQAGGFLNEETK